MMSDASDDLAIEQVLPWVLRESGVPLLAVARAAGVVLPTARRWAASKM